MRVVLAQISPKLQKCTIKEFENYLQDIGNSIDLVILPELALNGYLLKDAVFEDAYTIGELEEFAKLAQGFDLVFGAVLQEENRFFNSAIYCSNGKIVSIHRKTSLPNYGLFQEARFFFKGESVAPFMSIFGKTFVVICEELYNASIIEKIALNRADLVVVISNSPSRGFSKDGLLIQQQWESLLGTTALLSGANTIFVNRVGFEDGLGFWGGSCVLNPKAQILKRANLFQEQKLIVDIDEKLSQTQKYLLREY